MANGDDVDTQDQVPSPTPVTSGQEKDVNKELFGGQKPADMPTQQKEANQDLTQDTHPDPLMEERLKIYESDKQRYEESQRTYDQMRSEISRINEELRTTQVPQPPQLRRPPQLLMGGQQPGGTQGQPTVEQQDKGNSLGTIMMQAATLIAIGSAVFGRHRNPYASIVQQSSLGGFFSGLAQGQKEKAAEQLQQWNKGVELTDKLNKEDTQTYHDILANRRLELSQQMDLIKDIAAQRSDTRMYAAAARKDLDEIMKTLSDKAKARAAWAKGQLDVNTRAVNKWLESTSGLAWSQIVKEKYKIDPYKSHDDLMRAFDAYPISKWQADRKAGTSVDTEEEKTSASSTSGSGKSKDDPVVLQGSSDDELNRQFEQLPKGAFYTGPDGVTRQK